ncbi:MAG: N-acetyltransferase family protein [Flavobacteriaceae bacterium]
MVTIRPMIPSDWPAVSEIYGQGIETGFATFETEIPSYDTWNQNHLPSCRLVAERGEILAGWAALSPVSGRCVYGGVGEISVYVGKEHRGFGIGKLLLKHLILESEKQGLWTLQAGIFPENKASIKLHEIVGFRKIGFREKVGKLHGVWKDNLLFERRSKKVGLD